ncbi:DUF3149 domain-containing protein [Sulfurihydrogenibium azorense]|uniref:Uncharacterized protein n=1 Tax=Sulfurihydrogenibium azorense (strain DSM 15241 / OCM 825 / Az-Fu1) TaxID=204536 RepID=C1DVG8_SULAA|nr:DUF3149 domain-containing protein [Sulfurihydrogenibium azorense]ACN98551.1 hypothetical protein SULAZ_1133 [Sulfurihydrogenibium azorense Az-Fu1]MDM7274119.1 DUF3149 domain-containing protein [Sulfurihydrogenibium azorense]
MEMYVLFLILFTLGMVAYVVYFVKKSKEELAGKVEEISCKIDPLVQKISGEKYVCKDDAIEFQTEEKK